MNMKINDKLDTILKTKLFWIGIIIHIVTVVVMFILDTDINDMNEVLLYALQDVFKGINPYTETYLIGAVKNGVYEEYLMFFGYPPLLFLVYLPAMLYPV